MQHPVFLTVFALRAAFPHRPRLLRERHEQALAALGDVLGVGFDRGDDAVDASQTQTYVYDVQSRLVGLQHFGTTHNSPAVGLGAACEVPSSCNLHLRQMGGPRGDCHEAFVTWVLSSIVLMTPVAQGQETVTYTYDARVDVTPAFSSRTAPNVSLAKALSSDGPEIRCSHLGHTSGTYSGLNHASPRPLT